jgi:hypothetical protein
MFINDKASINHIIYNRLFNKASGLYKTGLTVANCRVVVEAAKRAAMLERRAKVAAVMNKASKVMKHNCKA